MKIGIVTQWDTNSLIGEVTSEGYALPFDYASGKTILSSAEVVEEPSFGEHKQPKGFSLKLPRVGDVIVFSSTDTGISDWGYAEHYLSAINRVVPSDFVHVDANS